MKGTRRNILLHSIVFFVCIFVSVPLYAGESGHEKLRNWTVTNDSGFLFISMAALQDNSVGTFSTFILEYASSIITIDYGNMFRFNVGISFASENMNSFPWLIRRNMAGVPEIYNKIPDIYYNGIDISVALPLLWYGNIEVSPIALFSVLNFLPYTRYSALEISVGAGVFFRYEPLSWIHLTGYAAMEPPFSGIRFRLPRLTFALSFFMDVRIPRFSLFDGVQFGLSFLSRNSVVLPSDTYATLSHIQSLSVSWKLLLPARARL